jgi:hypothetical protein
MFAPDAFVDELPPQSRADLLAYLEQLSGRKLRTRDDVHRYVEEVAAKKPEESRLVRFWREVKQVTWLVLLVFAFLQYYFTDILNQVFTLQQVKYFVPAAAPVVKSMLLSVIA